MTNKEILSPNELKQIFAEVDMPIQFQMYFINLTRNLIDCNQIIDWMIDNSVTETPLDIASMVATGYTNELIKEHIKYKINNSEK